MKNIDTNIQTVAVSACLLGENCKYNGGNNYNEKLNQWLRDKKVISICPEILGGLPTPRPSAEIVDGIVMNTEGQCVHEEFTRGAELALNKLKEENVNLVILQSRSPSCGVKQIYDGSFSRKLMDGQGIFAKMALEQGYRVLDIEDFRL